MILTITFEKQSKLSIIPEFYRHFAQFYLIHRDEGVKVLVHCKKGISRSASVVVAYIMKEKCYDLDEALRYVRTHRSTIRPNPAFLQQLIIYQGMLAARYCHSKYFNL